MARNRYDWNKVIELTEECVEQATSFASLLGAINARMAPAMPVGTFVPSLRRELKARRDVEFGDINSLRELLSGPETSPLATSLVNHMRTGGRRGMAISLLDLCEHFDRSPSSVEAAVAEAHEAGFFVDLTDDKHIIMPKSIPPTCTRIPVEMWTKPGRVQRYGIISDWHLANRKARLDVLEGLYDVFAEEGIKTVLVPGNLIDGEGRYNRYELMAHGVEGQIAFAAKHAPRRVGIVTKFLTADDHEGWWAKDIGLDIGRRMENGFRERGREDLVWIGHVERDLSLDDNNPNAVLRVMHPGGGTAYAISYKPQKIVEGFQGGEKPEGLLLGHYHKEGKFYVRNVNVVMCATGCDQTMFMRKRPLGADVGGSIVEIHLSPMGAVTRFKYEFFPFFDKGYYEKWDYASMFDFMFEGD